MHPLMVALGVAAGAAAPQASSTQAQTPPPASSAGGTLLPREPVPAHHPQGDVRSSVDALLGTRDGAVSPEQWRSLGPSATPILEEIVEDKAALSSRRGRAIEGMVALRSPRTEALLEKIIPADDEPFLVRVAAMRGAGRMLSTARLVALLKPPLAKATDVHIRAAAAEVLSRHRAGCAAVRAQSRREPADTQVAFEPALRRCGAK